MLIELLGVQSMSELYLIISVPTSGLIFHRRTSSLSFLKPEKRGHWPGLSASAGVFQFKAEEVIKTGINTSFIFPRFYLAPMRASFCYKQEQMASFRPRECLREVTVRISTLCRSWFTDIWYLMVCCQNTPSMKNIPRTMAAFFMEWLIMVAIKNWITWVIRVTDTHFITQSAQPI